MSHNTADEQPRWSATLCDMTYGTEPRRRRWSSDSSRSDEVDEAENWLAAYRPAPGERAPKSFEREVPARFADEPPGRHSRPADAPSRRPRHTVADDAPVSADLSRPARGKRRPASDRSPSDRPDGDEPGRPRRPADGTRTRFADAPPKDPYPPADPYGRVDVPPRVEPAPRGRRTAPAPEYDADSRPGRRRRRAETPAAHSPVDSAPAPPVSGGFGPARPVSGGFGPSGPVSGFGPEHPVSGGFGPARPVSGPSGFGAARPVSGPSGFGPARPVSGSGASPQVDPPTSGAFRGSFTPLVPRPPVLDPPSATLGPGGLGTAIPGRPPRPDDRTNGWAESGYDEPSITHPASDTRFDGRRMSPARPAARPEVARPDRAAPWSDRGARRLRLAEPAGLAPDALPRLPDHPRSRLWMGTLVFIGVVVVLAVCALGTYFVVNDERHGPADIRSGPSGPPLQKRDISSRTVDPAPLTEAEVFPKPQIIAAANEPPYQVLKTQAATDCRIAATDELATLLQQAGCSEVVRGTLKSPNGAYLVTAGIFNLTDEAAATQVHGAIKGIVDAQKGRFNGMAAGQGTEAMIRAPTHLGWNVRGHFLVYCVIARTDGQPFANGDAFPQQIIFDLVETHLRDGVIGARAVVTPSAAPGKASAGS
jgi:hypothetical protein